MREQKGGKRHVTAERDGGERPARARSENAGASSLQLLGRLFDPTVSGSSPPTSTPTPPFSHRRQVFVEGREEVEVTGHLGGGGVKRGGRWGGEGESGREEVEVTGHLMGGGVKMKRG